MASQTSKIRPGMPVRCKQYCHISSLGKQFNLCPKTVYFVLDVHPEVEGIILKNAPLSSCYILHRFEPVELTSLERVIYEQD
jgi:hypothetical protein